VGFHSQLLTWPSQCWCEILIVVPPVLRRWLLCCYVVVVSSRLATNDTYFVESSYRIGQFGQFVHNKNRKYITKSTKC
jgi:hypothetical protein